MKYTLVFRCLIGLLLLCSVTNSVTATPPCLFRENHIWLQVTEIRGVQPYSIGCEAIVAEMRGWDILQKKYRKVLISDKTTTAYCYKDEGGHWDCQRSDWWNIAIADTAVSLVAKYTKVPDGSGKLHTYRVAYGIQFTRDY